jgi:hypothetical protein
MPSSFTLNANGSSVTFNMAKGSYSAAPAPGIGVSIVNGRQSNIVVTLYTPGSPEAAAFEEPVAT